jgi:hypothetical protein
MDYPLLGFLLAWQNSLCLLGVNGEINLRVFKSVKSLPLCYFIAPLSTIMANFFAVTPPKNVLNSSIPSDIAYPLLIGFNLP